MTKTSIIGLDLAKRVFQAHGARCDGGVAFRKKLSRAKVLAFLALSRAALSRWKPAGVRIILDARSVTLITRSA